MQKKIKIEVYYLLQIKLKLQLNKSNMSFFLKKISIELKVL